MGLNIEVTPEDSLECDRSLDGGRFRAATGLTVPTWPEMVGGLAEDRTPYDDWRRSHGIT